MKENNLLLKNSLELPSPKQESWRYTDLTRFGLSKKNILSLNKRKAEILYIEKKEKKKKKADFMNLQEAKKRLPGLLKKYKPMALLGKEEDFFNELHYSLLGNILENSIFIHVKKSESAELKNIINLVSNGISNIHIIIVLEKGSRLDYIIEQKSSIKNNLLSLKTLFIEAYAEPGSRLNIYGLQTQDREKQNIINIANWKFLLKKGSEANYFIGEFGSRASRLKIETVLDEQGSMTSSNIMFFSKKSQHIDISNNVVHNAPNTKNNVLVKGALDDISKSVFRGKIKIIKNAQNTESFLSSRSLMISDNAETYAIPSLEIDANNVRASHSASLGKPEDSEIFYLMSRGLKRKEAERLIIKGFFHEIISKIKKKDLSDMFNKTIKKQIGG